MVQKKIVLLQKLSWNIDLTVSYIYDQNDQLIKEIHPYSYEKDADNGNGTSYAYDKNGNLTRVTNAFEELVQELSYNRINLPVPHKDASGNQTDFIYESDGQLREVRRGNPRRQQYEYNARGQITGIVGGNHEKTIYSTDGWGRITGTGFSDGVKEGFEYNYAEQVSRTINGNGNAIEYRYNSLGKVRERTDQNSQVVSAALIDENGKQIETCKKA